MFNASSPRFIASSLSTLYKFIQKSPLNSPELQDTYVKAWWQRFWLCYGNNGNIQIFVEIANANTRFFASMR
jgi:hypothetical protein